MKNILIAITVALVASLNAAAQTNPEIDIETNEVELQVINPAEPVKETKQEIKEREKKLRELNDDVAFAKAANSLRRGYFVLLAENIQIGRNSYRHYGINEQSNFILVQNTDGIIQFALNTGSPGINGLGGWTGKGEVRDKRITYADNGDVFMQFNVVSSKVNAQVYITLFHNSNYAIAEITGGTNITMRGKIQPYRDKNHR